MSSLTKTKEGGCSSMEWTTLTTFKFWIYEKIQFDIVLFKYDLNIIALVNEHEIGELDKSLTMVIIEIQAFARGEITLIVRLKGAHYSPNPGIARLLKNETMLFELRPIATKWLSWVSDAYDHLDKKGSVNLHTKSFLSMS